MSGFFRGVPWVWPGQDADGGDVQHWPGNPGETGRYELWAELREKGGECRISLHLGEVPLGESGPCPRDRLEEMRRKFDEAKRNR